MAPLAPLTNVPIKRKSNEADEIEQPPQKRTSWGGQASSANSRLSYWTVQWRNPQAKKHKTWEGDGVLQLEGNLYSLFSTDGKPMGLGKHLLGRALECGDEISVGGKDVLIDSSMDTAEFQSGRCFGSNYSLPSAAAPVQPELAAPKVSKPFKKPFAPLRPTGAFQPPFAKASVSAQPKQPAVTRQYPAAKSQVPVINLFEDEGSLVDDQYGLESTTGVKVSPTTEALWAVNWRRSTMKKNKTWDGDGMLHQRGNTVRFLSEDGKKSLGSKTCDFVLEVGSKLFINDKELEIERRLPLSRLNGTSEEIEIIEIPREEVKEPVKIPLPIRKFAAPTIVKQVERQEDVQPKVKPSGPVHDPTVKEAIVMKEPTTSHQQRYNPKQRPIVPVVVDPLLASKLRPHQVQGVKFMYECVMGMGKHEGQGCILGDEMGLGKTLQTIALIWTLLKQNPYGGTGPVIGKAMVVCPVSLLENWRKEFHKWIGRDRIGVFTGDCDKAAIKQFVNSRHHQILIIGYERLRGVINDLAYCNPPIGLIVCDEGHRLKTAGNKTSKMFEALRTVRRVILSGTPIQNDLGEFHAMADFCNPGLLDEYLTFKRVFETPILASRMPDCSSKVLELGRSRAAQLQALARSFVLRREASILSNYLPPKYEYVVFLSPTELQLSMMRTILNPDKLGLLLSSSAKSLALIQTLSKLCNSPALLKRKNDAASDSTINAAIRQIPARTTPDDVSLSGKLTVLSHILRELHKNTDEKCIIVSHYTSTLDIIETFCLRMGYTLYRLDGQTPQHQRQEYVDKFNKASKRERFLFLLSAKAGGVGLNLIGASRLVLVDGDWNPSHDLQAMARIHRDGQKRPVFIYRLVTAGTIDEKIYQRQITKMGLSEAMMGNPASSSKSKTDSFTSKELRDLFNVYPYVSCHTHELLGCPCSNGGSLTAEEEVPSKPGRKFVQEDSDDEELEMGFVRGTQVNPDKLSKKEMRQRREALSSLSEWRHIDCTMSTAAGLLQDSVLRALMVKPSGNITGNNKSENSDELWDAFDYDDGTEDGALAKPNAISVRDLPGGSVTFTFERVSKTDL
ncbi:hypothetical protein CPB86DRAFT_85171 [Serendipita vermifera]|nr:hypothetical protein CPB86DRAFT_85171 [Serendipita vermifera]